MGSGASGWGGCGADACDVCMGDCDSNADCKSGLSCFQRNGNTPVPGCSGDGVSGYDYCVVPELTSGASRWGGCVALKNATGAWATVTPTQIANPACPASNATAIRRSLAALATGSVVMTTAWCQSSHQVLAVGEGAALKNATCAWATVTPTQIANPACPASNATAIRRSLAAGATESVVMTTAWCQSSRRSGKVVTVGKGVALTNATRAWATVSPTKIANPACPASIAWALRRSLDAL